MVGIWVLKGGVEDGQSQHTHFTREIEILSRDNSLFPLGIEVYTSQL